MSFAIFHGDALELLRTVPSNSVDSIVTDPPAGIYFMGQRFDHDRGGRGPWITWLTAITTECTRVLKPGGHGLFWAIPRTSHWTATGVEDGGFEIRDVITHHYGSAMAHYADASKAIDKKLGTSHLREVFATYSAGGNAGTSCAEKGGTFGVGVANSEAVELERTLGGSPEAKAWDGFATALKPASEHWILARKPLEGTLADNVLRYGTGALNIDGCRVRIASQGASLHPGGRWPPNAVFTHSEACQCVGARRAKANGSIPANGAGAAPTSNSVYGEHKRRGAWQPHGNGDGTETVQAFECAPDCPIGELEQQAKNSGRYFPQFEWSELDDLSLFLYAKKAGTKERDAGLEAFLADKNGRHNPHKTVKPVAFMRWATRLVTPPGGVCLDIFVGSGTTGVACVLESFHFMGFDETAAYCAVSQARIEHWARMAA